MTLKPKWIDGKWDSPKGTVYLSHYQYGSRRVRWVIPSIGKKGRWELSEALAQADAEAWVIEQIKRFAQLRREAGDA